MKLVIRTIILCESLMVYSVLIITVNADEYEHCSMAVARNIIKMSCEQSRWKRSLNYISDNENRPNSAQHEFRMSQMLKNQMPPNVTITTKVIPIRRVKRDLPKDFITIHEICCKEPKRCEKLPCPPLDP